MSGPAESSFVKVVPTRLRGMYPHCPGASHLSQVDDPGHHFPGLLAFVRTF